MTAEEFDKKLTEFAELQREYAQTIEESGYPPRLRGHLEDLGFRIINLRKELREAACGKRGF